MRKILRAVRFAIVTVCAAAAVAICEELAQRYASPDGLHPNDRGYALLADFAWPPVARVMHLEER